MAWSHPASHLTEWLLNDFSFFKMTSWVNSEITILIIVQDEKMKTGKNFLGPYFCEEDLPLLIFPDSSRLPLSKKVW